MAGESAARRAGRQGHSGATAIDVLRTWFKHCQPQAKGVLLVNGVVRLGGIGGLAVFRSM